MTKRYLSQQEAESKLISGKSIECFLGPCTRGGVNGIRWLSISLTPDKNHIKLCRYDSSDLGSSEYLDLYSFGPLDPNLELDEPDETLMFDEFDELWSAMECNYRGSSSMLVNQGFIQDEYHLYKLSEKS